MDGNLLWHRWVAAGRGDFWVDPLDVFAAAPPHVDVRVVAHYRRPGDRDHRFFFEPVPQEGFDPHWVGDTYLDLGIACPGRVWMEEYHHIGGEWGYSARAEYVGLGRPIGWYTCGSYTLYRQVMDGRLTTVPADADVTNPPPLVRLEKVITRDGPLAHLSYKLLRKEQLPETLQELLLEKVQA